MKIVKWIKRQKWLLLGVVLLLLGGIGWSLAHRMWPIFQTEGYADAFLPIACQNGFLLRNDDSTLTFYNWHGKKLWDVSLPPPDWTGWRTFSANGFSDEHQYSLQDDGSALATVTVRSKTLLVQQWQNGRKVSEIILPIKLTYQTILNNGKKYTRTTTYYHVTYRNDGRLLLTVRNLSDTSLFLLSQNRLIADGQFHGVTISEDGSCCWRKDKTRLYYYSAIVKNGRIIIKLKWSVPIPSSPSLSFWLQGDKLVDQFGTIYGTTEKPAIHKMSPGELSHKILSRKLYLSSDGDDNGYIISTDSVKHIVKLPAFPMKNLAPKNRSSLYADLDERNSAITPDGRYYALLYYIGRPELIEDIINRLQSPAPIEPLITGIFNRSGKRVAAIHLQLPYVPISVADQMDICPPYFEPILSGISPDGKAILITTPEPQSPDVIPTKITLYRRL